MILSFILTVIYFFDFDNRCYHLQKYNEETLVGNNNEFKQNRGFFYCNHSSFFL